MTTNTDTVTIEELDIVRVPGFETGGFQIETFTPGINLVHGPNAAGKTTTADSIVKLLWPDAATDGEQLVGQLSLNGDQWRVDVTNGSPEYQRNGQEVSPPNFPSADQRDRYLLSLHDLLQHQTRNESFAETIIRASAGGYDLDAAHDELGYDDSPITRRKGVYQDADEAVSAWRDQRGKAQSLEEERTQLTRLQNELNAAKQARETKAALEQSITFREAKSRYDTAKARLDDYPDVLEDVDGDELSQIDSLEEEIEDWRRQKQAAEEKMQRAEETLAEADLPDGGILNGVLDRLKERRDRLDDCESRVATLEEELAGAEAERENARDDIPLDIAQDDLIELETGSWGEVSEFARAAVRLQAERQQRDALDQWADAKEKPDADLQSLERGSKALENWLMASPEAELSPGDNAAFRVGAVAGAVVSLTGVALGLLVNPLLFGLVLVGIGLSVYGYRHRQRPESQGSDRDPHERTFGQTGLKPPATWSEEGVRSRLVELYEAIAQHKISDERKQQREAVIVGQDLESKENEFAEKREQLRDHLGAAPETTDIELAVILRRVLAWQTAHDEVVSLEAKITTATENLQEALTALQTDLGEYGYEDVEDSPTATQRIRDLEQRQSDHDAASRELAGAEETIGQARNKIDRLQDEREQVFTAIGVEPGDRDTLAELCEQVDDYEEAAETVRKTGAVVESEREKLESLPGYDSVLLEMELPALQQQQREKEETAAEYDDIRDRITTIETKISDAKSDNAFEQATTKKERALDALADQLGEDYSSMVGHALVEHVREETIEASRPAVFQRANELLATITHGRYRLVLSERESTFRAYDEINQRGYPLDELSSGTRVQILLAVRLAFVEQEEQGAKLPIVLDETLANTDDLRAEIIIDSMIELAKQGRQIFYFTAQGDEIAKWQAALTDTADVEWTTIDLAEARGLDRTVHVPAIATMADLGPNPPDPDGHDRNSYAEALDVQAFNPYEGPGTAHLWYVVDDVETLHEFLEMGIERWGQLRNLLDRGRSDFLPANSGTLSEIRQNAEALAEFSESWRHGRGDPVDRSVLEDSGAVSSNFIDRVTELAQSVGGDGQQLVDALYDGEVNGFWKSKTEELEEYLQANGHIVSRDSLSNDEIRIRMIQRLLELDVPRDQAADRVDTLLTRMAGETDD